jgi:dUTPase
MNSYLSIFDRATRGTIQPLTTGIAIQCPDGTYAHIVPRSGLTIKKFPPH